MTFDLPASLDAAHRQHAEGCVKITEDLARYRALILKRPPDGVIEIGTFSGKSALWLARETGRPVFTVDVNPQVDIDTREQWLAHQVTGHVGRSTEGATLWAAKDWMLRRHVTDPLVVLDGDHSADTVLDELRVYGRWVQPGGYVVVEDTLVRWMPWEQTDNGGPYRGSPADAVDAFLAGGSPFEVDADLDGMFSVGQYPGGWLRRNDG